MGFPIRSGNWLSKRETYGEVDPNPRGFGRLEVLLAGDLNCRVHREGEAGWVLMPTEELQTWWKPMKAPKCTNDFSWVRTGASLVWTQQSYSAGTWRGEDIPVQVGIVRRNGWFTTFNLTDNRLWFWNMDFIAEHEDFRPVNPNRFERRDVV